MNLLLSQKKGSRFQVLMTDIRDFLVLKKIGTKKNDQSTSQAYTRTLPIKRPATIGNVLREDDKPIDYERKEEIKQLPEYLTVCRKLKPFIKCGRFGKATTADQRGGKMKKIIYPLQKTQSIENKSITQKYSFENLTYEQHDGYDSTNIYEIIHHDPLNPKLIKMKKCLTHINSIRLYIKKIDYKICFFQLKDDLSCMSKHEKKQTVKLEKFYEVLRRFKIMLNRDLFEFLLKELNLMEEDTVFFEEALNLLNWRFDFPSLPIYGTSTK